MEKRFGYGKAVPMGENTSVEGLFNPTRNSMTINND